MSQRRYNLIVKLGIAFGILLTFVVFVAFFFLLPNSDQEPGQPNRFKLAIEVLVFPALFFLILIIHIGSEGFGNPAEDPTTVLASSHAMDVDSVYWLILMSS